VHHLLHAIEQTQRQQGHRLAIDASAPPEIDAPS
jgi:hypothetical protein